MMATEIDRADDLATLDVSRGELYEQSSWKQRSYHHSVFGDDHQRGAIPTVAFLLRNDGKRSIVNRYATAMFDALPTLLREIGFPQSRHSLRHEPLTFRSFERTEDVLITCRSFMLNGMGCCVKPWEIWKTGSERLIRLRASN